MKKIYGYVRFSTIEQHLGRQLKALGDFGVRERHIATVKERCKSLSG